jgi:hypothetical protein
VKGRGFEGDEKIGKLCVWLDVSGEKVEVDVGK